MKGLAAFFALQVQMLPTFERPDVAETGFLREGKRDPLHKPLGFKIRKVAVYGAAADRFGGGKSYELFDRQRLVGMGLQNFKEAFSLLCSVSHQIILLNLRRFRKFK